MQSDSAQARRLRMPERCRRSPSVTYDRTFGLHLCNVKNGLCYFRGAVFVLDVDGRRFECRKIGGDAAQPAQ